MEPPSFESHPLSKEDNTQEADGKHLPEDQQYKAVQKNENSQSLFGNFRLSKRNSKKSDDTGEPSSPEKKESLLGSGLSSFRSSKRFFKQENQIDGSGSPEKNDSFGLSRLSFKLGNKTVNKQGEELSSPEKKESPGFLVSKLRNSINVKKKIDFDESEKTMHEDKTEHEKLPGIDMNTQPSLSPFSEDNTQHDDDRRYLPGDQEFKASQKNQTSQKIFGNFRISKRNSKKLDETEERNSPEKKESILGSGLNFRSSKRSSKRQNQTDESGKNESFGLSRLGKKSANKHDQGEELSSPEKKELSGAPGFLVNKMKSSFKPRKKIDFNESENNSQSEEPKHEEKAEAELLSVMQINELIHSKQLQKAYENVKLMEDKLIEECISSNFHENVTEFTIRGKDVDLLYKSLFNIIRSIVKESLDKDQVDGPSVAAAFYVIDKEASTQKKTTMTLPVSEIPHLGQPRRWKELWKEAVKSSVTNRINSVPLSTTTKTWLIDHLECLKTNTVQDLMKVKNSLKSLYPGDYNVCDTYLRSFHDALSSHLQNNVVHLSIEFSQLYCLLNWVMNTYRSDEFMDSPELQPEMNPSSLAPLLVGECLQNVKRNYNAALQETIKTYFTNIIEIEKRRWDEGEEPEEETLKDSSLLPIYLDVEEMIGKHVRQSALLSNELETSSFQACVEELGTFATRLQAAFQDWAGTNFTDLFVQYSVVYIIGFMKLRHNATQSDAEQCKKAETSLNDAIEKLKNHLRHVFMINTKPHFQDLITKKWLSKNTAFNAIMKSTGVLCQHLKYLSSLHDKDFAGDIHKYLVKEYIWQIMKRKMSLTHLSRKKAAQKMREEGDLLNKAAEEMGSGKESLYHAIHCIAEIIGSKKKDEIKPQLDLMFQLYPDVSEEHILCILYLHGIRRSNNLLEHFQKLQDNPQTQDGPVEKLFAEIKCSTQVACFAVCLR
ncbi:exocyst complex component 3-like protein 4 [Mixophyes fleayi]|uniref:exocyst complex component 3-like protein 4 n=1 Tax=Mixophyes fleayi TaxID=3061075 RepID=UPI003F4DA1D7